LCVLAECLEIFVYKIPFEPNIVFFRELNDRLWKILESLDDISFSNSMVTSVLNSLHQKEDFELLYPKGLAFGKEQENLLPLFQHKISMVRSSVYALEVSLLKVAKPANYKNSKEYFQNVLRLSIQNLMVEFGKVHVENLLIIVEESIVNLWSVDPTFCVEMIRYLLESSCQYNFAEVIGQFKSFAKMNYEPYSFVDISTNPTINLSQVYERLLKAGILLNGVINRSTEIVKTLLDLSD